MPPGHAKRIRGKIGVCASGAGRSGRTVPATRGRWRLRRGRGCGRHRAGPRHQGPGGSGARRSRHGLSRVPRRHPAGDRDRSVLEPAVFVAPLHRLVRTAAASSDETVRSSVARPVTGRAGRALWRPTTGRGTGHRPPRSLAAHRSGLRMIGGRIYDDTVLVGFALGRSVYVLAAGKLACPECAGPLTCAAGYVPPRGGPSRCGPRPPSAPTPETRCWAPSRGGTPRWPTQ